MTTETCSNCGWHEKWHGVWRADRNMEVKNEDPIRRRPCKKFVPQNQKGCGKIFDFIDEEYGVLRLQCGKWADLKHLNGGAGFMKMEFCPECQNQSPESRITKSDTKETYDLETEKTRDIQTLGQKPITSEGIANLSKTEGSYIFDVSDLDKKLANAEERQALLYDYKSLKLKLETQREERQRIKAEVEKVLDDYIMFLDTRSSFASKVNKMYAIRAVEELKKRLFG